MSSFEIKDVHGKVVQNRMRRIGPLASNPLPEFSQNRYQADDDDDPMKDWRGPPLSKLLVLCYCPPL